MGCLTVRVVTTCNAAGWAQYGRRMAQTFVALWPEDARLTVYAEGFEPDVAGVDVRSLPDWIDGFKSEHAGHPDRRGLTARGYDFRFDGVKFAHKVAALTDFGLRESDGIMIWLDADTVTHAAVTHDWLASLFPPAAYIAWLERKSNFPECGFVMFRCGHGKHHTIMSRFCDVYAGGAVFRMAETHDSFVLQQLITKAHWNGEIPAPASLSGNAAGMSHPFACGPLGSRLDHLKGPRKSEGRSRRADFAAPRPEPYWRAG